MKRLFAVCLSGVLLLCLCGACGERELRKLETPSGFEVQENAVTWGEVDGAVGYDVVFKGEEQETEEAQFFLPEDAEGGNYTIEVLALGDGETVEDSDWAKFTFFFDAPGGGGTGGDDEIVQSGYEGGLHFTLLPERRGYEVEVDRRTVPSAKVITIPEIYCGLPVTRLADSAFCWSLGFDWQKDPYLGIHCNLATDVILPSSLKEIGSGAFDCMIKLEKIEIPDSVEKIGSAAFESCHSLKHVRLPRGLKTIPIGCFENCDLEEIEIPDSVEVIERRAFAGQKCNLSKYSKYSGSGLPEFFYTMQSLKKVVIPDSVKQIGNQAFFGCSNLSEIVLPKHLERLDWMVFQGTKWLTSQPDGPIMINGDLFYGYLGDLPASYTLPANVKYVAGGAFCSVWRMPEDKEYNWWGAPENEVAPLTNPTVNNLREVIFPDGAELIGEEIFFCCDELTRVRLPGDLVTLPAHIFHGCYSLEELELPDTLKHIESSAFWGCSFKNFELPEGLEILGGSVFNHCEDLEWVVFPHSLKQVGSLGYTVNGHDLNTHIYYKGTAEEWKELIINSGFEGYSERPGGYLVWRSDPYKDYAVYFFSAEEPDGAGMFWHYVDGVPAVR